MFQSRNRDAFHFKYPAGFNSLLTHLFSTFQSRNRDAFHFKTSISNDDKCLIPVSIS